MGIARVGILVVAAIAAGVAALLVRNMMSDDNKAIANAPAQIVQMPTSQVLVASRDLMRGQRLEAGDLRWQPWPEDAISASYIDQGNNPDAIQNSENGVVRVAMTMGEPVMRDKIVTSDTTGFLAAVLDPGMRAISTKISPETGAGGFILPNDRVDVILTEENQSDSGIADASAKIIMENVRVLAIDQTIQEQDGEQVVVGKTATLELSPGQSERLALGNMVGELSLALRSLTDSGPDANQNADNLSDMSGIIRVFRYGAESNISVGSSR